MHCSRFGNHVFLKHQRPHVVGTKCHCKLSDFESLGYPTALDVADIVQIKSRDRLRLEILERTGRRDVRKFRVVGLKGPANECRKASCFVLQLPHSLQVFNAFGQRFDMPEHHCHRADSA